MRRLAYDATFTTKALVTAAASAIPVVGGPIAAAIGIWEGERVSRRVEDFVTEVAGRFARVEAEKLDRDYIDSEAFRDAVISAVQAAKRSSGHEKRSWVASLLVGAATAARPGDLDVEALLDLVGELSEHQLRILHWVWSNRRRDWTFHSAWLPAELQGPDFDLHLGRLQSVGMVLYVADRPTTGSYDWRIFRITPTLARLASVLEAGGSVGAIASDAVRET